MNHGTKPAALHEHMGVDVLPGVEQARGVKVRARAGDGDLPFAILRPRYSVV
jgi:hypothetical protein